MCSFYGLQQLFANEFLAVFLKYFLTRTFFDIEAIDRGSARRGDFSYREIEFEFSQGGRNMEKEAGTIFGIDINDGPAFGVLVVKLDRRLHLVVFKRLVKRGRLRGFANESGKIHFVHQDL